ncbi:phBC6A51 family helix-turn-helix protein [Dysgonomonas sp. 511]|uniref:phBC6A51 family helix-turn-helix protein n=1 Tax=Dysgonomonas sp. 511 TaxID=2302930 RepID=UPI0013CF7B57|nr:phBC6A51 family helix-turn-helix protein [Dysgonomonas sp. 511]NDV77905.1 hypothetical protein [Dysgonomonas sp. 511]
MAKFTTKLAERILEMIEHDMYTVAEICRATGINRKTFYEWKNTKPEFCAAVEDAVERRDEALVMLARMSLKKKLEGYTLTEERLYYEPSKGNPQEMVLKKKVVKKKEVMPDHHTIKLALERENKKAKTSEANEDLYAKPTEIGVVDEETKMELEDFVSRRANMYRIVVSNKKALDPSNGSKVGLSHEMREESNNGKE